MKKSLSLLLALALLLVTVIPASAVDAPAALTAVIEITNISKYGNVKLTLGCDEIKAAGYAFGDVVTVAFLDRRLDLPFCSNYSDVDSGIAGLFARDEDTLVSLSINMGDFATAYGIAVKSVREDGTITWSFPEGVQGPVECTISLKEAGGYYDAYLLHQLSYTDARTDYPELSDAQFANFRAVTTTGMGEGILYRTASPVDPQHNRNTYADAALRDAGVTVVLNLSDTPAGVQAYEGYAASYYATTDSIELNMTVDYSSADFQDKLAEGLRFLAETPGVYAVNCLEGKDRTGFVIALLECLMGASLDEVVDDYMTTYYNYYGITAEDPRYEVVANGNIRKSLQYALGTAGLESADLAALAEERILGIGLSEAELAALKMNLSAAAPARTDALDRAEITQLLCDFASGAPKRLDCQFADVRETDPFAPAVCWAAEAGIVKGVSEDRFAPHDAVTRQMCVTMLWRYAGYLGLTGRMSPAGLEGFADAGAVSGYALDAFRWAAGSGIIDAGAAALDPAGTITRAQLDEMLRAFSGLRSSPASGQPA